MTKKKVLPPFIVVKRLTAKTTVYECIPTENFKLLGITKTKLKTIERIINKSLQENSKQSLEDYLKGYSKGLTLTKERCDEEGEKDTLVISVSDTNAEETFVVEARRETGWDTYFIRPDASIPWEVLDFITKADGDIYRIDRGSFMEMMYQKSLWKTTERREL